MTGRPAPVMQRIIPRLVIDPDTHCWNFAGRRSPLGYGYVGIGKQLYLVHRVVFEHIVGTIPEGHVLHHLCDNPSCANPEHLLAVTPKQHGRFAKRALQTHCKYGHEYTPENTVWNKPGTLRRTCRQCRSERDKNRRHR